MSLRALGITMLVAGWAIFVLALLWPSAALVGRCVTQPAPHPRSHTAPQPAPATAVTTPNALTTPTADVGAPSWWHRLRPAIAGPTDGFAFSGRQLGLLARSVVLAAGATIVALLLALPGAYAVGRAGRLQERPLIAALLVAALLFPPMVYTFGWQRVLPGLLRGHFCCVGVWALWGWPIPALVIGTGWRRRGKAVIEAALLNTTPTAAWLRVVLPVLLRYVVLSALILFLLYLGDYGVPHACGLRVYATELLGWAQNSALTIDTAWASIPPAVVTLLVWFLLTRVWRRCAGDEDAGGAVSHEPARSGALLGLAVAGCIVSFVVPLVALAAHLSSAAALLEASRVYGTELAWSAGLAALGGVLAVLMGVAVAGTPRGGMVALSWAVLLGALPGALVGSALIAAYHAVPPVYDHWPILTIAFVARFGWVGILVAWLAAASVPAELAEQARSDGAGPLALLLHLHVPMYWPTLLAGSAVVAALALGDIATSTLVAIPSVRLVAHVIIEKFHRLEDDMLIALSLWLVCITLPVVAALAGALRRRRLTDR
ncbi:MAG TPA: hypothetical protein PKK06_17275 [Phycisphaerae bacterium]|nr:hypothetical protein [Phycisphaerae bacterium]HNU46949.1 hypothetical protein [Phycisphaerae bacterium]